MYRKGGEDHARGFGFGGFSMKSQSSGKAAIPPPPPPVNNPLRKGTSVETHLSQIGFGMPGSLAPARGFGAGSNIGKRRVKSEEEYFEDDEEVNPEDLEYQPAPGSPSNQNKDGDSSESEDDPLDAFMAGIEQEVATQETKSKKTEDKKGVRDDLENEDDEESYYRYMEENPMAGVNLDDDDLDIEYDMDGNAIIPDYKKIIDPLPEMDHSEIDYEPFTKNFYEEHEEIAKLPITEVNDLREKLGMKISGILPPKPVSSFAHFGFDEQLLKTIRKAKYTSPMPIQAQGVPVALQGRDVIGIAKTGSGKTAAFVWPLLIHIMDQKELEKGDGPIGLILAPTRELSQQIYHETKKFGKAYNMKVVCAYGGGSLWEQCKACEEGAEIIVATPGRLIDLVKKKATNLKRVTYLVFDEADKMFDMGFEPQVRSIADHVRPERQTLLFSATFRRKVERLARDILTDPIRVVQGDIGEANEDVTQLVKVLPPGPNKWLWLTSRLVQFTTEGSVLIFVTKKANSEELASNLKTKDFKVGLIHGDMHQEERNQVITAFKKQEIPILVATDVAARGLDIPHIKNVVNYDVARDIDTHTHRIGRTGRAGTKGTAYTLIVNKDKDFAGHLVRNLEGANQVVPQDLLDIALQNPWFSKTRHKQSKAKKLNMGGSGLGFRDRPGLGSANPQGDAKSFTHYEPARYSGPQSDRVAAMKSAFSAQFKSNFVTALDENVRNSGTSSMHAPLPSGHSSLSGDFAEPSEAPEMKKRKKSRWE